VCLAAICAMDVGRCAVSKKYIRQREQRAAAPQQPAVPPGQRLITDMLQPAPPTAAQLQHRQQLAQRQLQETQERQRLEAQLLEDTKSLAKARFGSCWWILCRCGQPLLIGWCKCPLITPCCAQTGRALPSCLHAVVI
jgi:hypothetical protein